ncbi:hypothetical protein STCU_06454 [Strigomonas culicis]|uniref:PH domain-containing protein n=1 Tax=Strigomonas culicis TaxID=28005 RepID=S9UA47_9TRYP|nr:hypothetical protein STCU_06454 [Strigomonas culicis]|eukprot:EPY25833.1 hypothetical protein STCU_06454 [Strigomonas culicis]
MNKVISNIKEEELKHVTAIQGKRDEIREKQLALIRQKAAQESAQMIKDQEAKKGATLAELKQSLENKKKENASLQQEHDAKVKEYEARLEQARTQKEEQEGSTARLKEEMVQLEEDLVTRQNALQGKQKQLELAKMDKKKGLEAIKREHANVQAGRKKVLDERKAERQQWIAQIKDINEKVLDQLRSLAEDRKQSGEEPSASEKASEQAVKDDIKTIEEYLPKLITLNDVPTNAEETESIRRQFDDVFAQERQAYLKKIEREKERKTNLEKGLEAFRNKVLESAQVKAKEGHQDAIKKEQHLIALVDQVMTYLRQGVKLTKISRKGQEHRLFYFLSEDSKKIFSCELDNQGSPVNRKKPPVAINVSDIRKVVLGCYTPSFTSFATESALSKSRMSAISDNGTFRQDPTQSITPENLGLNNYRSFALLLPGGKSLEVVCDSDTDCEAWLVGLKRILNIKSKVERVIESRIHEGRVPTEEQICAMAYGENLDIRQMNGVSSISAEEGVVCSECHVPPALFLRIKKEMAEKSKSCSVTVYDLRVASGLDLIRSCWVYDHLIEKKHIPFPL